MDYMLRGFILPAAALEVRFGVLKLLMTPCKAVMLRAGDCRLG